MEGGVGGPGQQGLMQRSIHTLLFFLDPQPSSHVLGPTLSTVLFVLSHPLDIKSHLLMNSLYPLLHAQETPP